ncbi:MAG: hypothetical protein WA979_06000 [Pacificimonas sp.]
MRKGGTSHRTAAALALCTSALSLAACEPDPRIVEATEPELVPAAVQPPPDPRRYIGRWAEDTAEHADECMTKWWRFWPDEVLVKETQGKCKILPPDASFSDTDIRTICPGKRENWTLDYDESGDVMTVARPEQDDVILRRCT